jgi:starch phosphorylase
MFLIMKITEENIDFHEPEVAYFSMEIGIDPKIPTYAGGLGILAGDTLRSAADLELPIIGITLLYKKGYFRQKIDEHGNQFEEPIEWHPHSHLKLLPNKVNIKVEGRDVYIQAWLYTIKGVTGKLNPIIFLDTDLHENSDYDRTITHILYGNDDRCRLAQEMVLGIGGVRMLNSLGCYQIKKYHMNEGHSALLALELAKISKEKKIIEDVRQKCVFTTHTPIPAGHDQFDKELAEKMLGDNLLSEIKNELFIGHKLNMTYLGLRFSKFVNGVAKKHGEVSRTMFPGYHIESITNGVHSAFWVSEPFKKLYDKYISGWEIDPFSLRYVLSVPKEEIWRSHQKAKKKLITYVNRKYGVGMNVDSFTIGFARRAATYKRHDMLFSDATRLIKIASKYPKGIQIIYSGKAHPKDWEGKQIIKNVIQKMEFVKERIKVCYIEDYDIEIAKLLVSGADLWVNTPMRPKEASGTSGMKAAHNGVPQFSTLDGWWLEGHIENVTGWSIGSHPHDLKEPNHREDVDDMYMKLEYVILPKFYNEKENWVEVMRHAISINASFFNTHRMVQQYVLNAYFK